MEVTFRMAEEEYIKDLYNIGFIVFASPIITGGLTCLGGFIGGIFFGGNVEFGFTDVGLFALGCQILAGFLIMVYIAWKYYYKKAVKGET